MNQQNFTVANLCLSRAWGGLEMSSVKMTRLFAQAGYRSLEICQPNSPTAQALFEQKLEARLTNAGKYFSPKATMTIRRWVREENIRVIFLHYLRDLWLVTPALWGMKDVKLYGFARMMIRGVSKKDPLHRLMYGRLNGLISFSEQQRQALLQCLPVPAEKYIYIPNGVDLRRFQKRPRREDIRRQWGFQEDNFVFGLIGRLDRQKGSLEFIEAAGRVLSEYPKARFVLVGGNTIGGEGELLIGTKARLHEMGITNQIVLTDYRSDIPDVMNALDAFVLPSYEEAFGNVTLEAMASGLPVIGTNSGATPEILEQGRAGLLCEPRSSDSLADAMTRFLKDPGLAQTLATQGLARAQNEYDMDKVFKRVEALV